MTTDAQAFPGRLFVAEGIDRTRASSPEGEAGSPGPRRVELAAFFNLRPGAILATS